MKNKYSGGLSGFRRERAANLIRKATLISLFLLLIMLMSVSLSDLVTRIQALTLYDSGDPTSAEQLVLEYINRARANPTAEGARLGINIMDGLCDPNAVGVRPPLAMNKILLSLANYHSWDMYTNNYFDHDDLNGHGPGWRMTNAGYDWNYWGENIAVGSGGYSATALEDILMVDSGTTCRGHRVNLFSSNVNEVGVGYYAGGSPNPSGWSNFLTQDFGSTSVGPFLVGVVYNDADGDNFYDIGEGISGVTITLSAGTYYAVSSTSGGYAIPLTGMSGSITVTASSSSFGTITKTVSLTGQNVKLDWAIAQVTSVSSISTIRSTQLLTSITTTTLTSYTSTQTSTSTIPTVTTVVLVPLTTASTVQSTQLVTSTITTTATSYTSTRTSTSTIPTITTITVAAPTTTSTVQTTQTLISTGTTTVTGYMTTTSTSYASTTTSTDTSIIYTTVTKTGASAGAPSSLAYLGFISLLAIAVGDVIVDRGMTMQRARSRLVGMRTTDTKVHPSRIRIFIDLLTIIRRHE